MPENNEKSIYLDHSRPEYKFRLKRFQNLRSLINSVLSIQKTCRILDIGGTPIYWKLGADLLEDGRVTVDLLNLHPPAYSLLPNTCSLIGDGRAIPMISDGSYDICHSNSVIEHVGDWSDMQAMASETRRVATHYFVQAPSFWFPYEPHFRTPFFHWLPPAARAYLLLWRNLGFYPRATDIIQAQEAVNSIRLPTRQQMRRLFPDAKIIPEKIGPFTKSYMAIR